MVSAGDFLKLRLGFGLQLLRSSALLRSSLALAGQGCARAAGWGSQGRAAACRPRSLGFWASTSTAPEPATGVAHAYGPSDRRRDLGSVYSAMLAAGAVLAKIGSGGWVYSFTQRRELKVAGGAS